MQSVEELCDDIALINRAQVVLSGQTDQVRRAHGSNTARIVYEGTLSTDSLEQLQVLEQTHHDRHSLLRLQLTPDESLRSLIERLPHTISLQSIELEYPSMHDIFLSTVTAQ